MFIYVIPSGMMLMHGHRWCLPALKWIACVIWDMSIVHKLLMVKQEGVYVHKRKCWKIWNRSTDPLSLPSLIFISPLSPSGTIYMVYFSSSYHSILSLPQYFYSLFGYSTFVFLPINHCTLVHLFASFYFSPSLTSYLIRMSI